MFEAHADVRGAALPVDACLGRVAGLRPRGALRGQGLPRQDAQFRFVPVEPAAVPGRKYPPYALGQGPRL